MANAQSPGFHEAQGKFVSGEGEVIGQIRRFGFAGPAYEILKLGAPGHVAIHVIESGELLDYPLSEALLDPIAETIP
jgi:hypothetical protein